jgi:hypothetical protein
VALYLYAIQSSRKYINVEHDRLSYVDSVETKLRIQDGHMRIGEVVHSRNYMCSELIGFSG